jgi:hypothetical protein
MSVRRRRAAWKLWVRSCDFTAARDIAQLLENTSSNSKRITCSRQHVSEGSGEPVRNCGSLCRVSFHDHRMNTGHKTFLAWLKHDVKHHSTFTFFIGTQSFPFIPDILQSGRVCGLAESVVTISHSVALSCPLLPAPARSCPLLPAQDGDHDSAPPLSSLPAQNNT